VGRPARNFKRDFWIADIFFYYRILKPIEREVR
jgi:hypothetical protein